MNTMESNSNSSKRTRELHQVLQKLDVFETALETNLRNVVMHKLKMLFKRWVKDVSLSRNMSPESAFSVGGEIHTFGSYRLGVHQKGADIDALCIAPRHICRADYFKSFFSLLKSQEEVTDLRAIEEAYVPVIKMNFSGIEIDLLFARLNMERIPDKLDIRKDSLLINLDPRCVRSLNGLRVTDQILRLVPNVDNFQSALRAVRVWAKRKGIYGNIMGYLGGVSWAIMVAKTCLSNPDADPATLVEKFFQLFSMWKWPKPMYLKRQQNLNLGFDFWDGQVNISDRDHLMPIITPAYPEQNSTFNVSLSSKTIIKEALQDGHTVINEIVKGISKWEKLFEPVYFFNKYKSYITLFVGSSSSEHYVEWCGFVEAKIRHLIGTLERNPCITLAHVNPEMLTPPKLKLITSNYCSSWFIGLDLKKNEVVNVDLINDVKIFIDTTKRQAEQINLFKEYMTLESQFIQKNELKKFISSSLIKRESTVRKNLLCQFIMDGR